MVNKQRLRNSACLAILWIGIGAGFASAQEEAAQLESPDPYGVVIVRGLLAESADFSTGFSEKQRDRLGDRAAIAVLKIFSDQELRNPATARKVLRLIETVFRNPQLISVKEDREPRVTLFLLGYLEQVAPDRQLRQEISAVAQRLARLRSKE